MQQDFGFNCVFTISSDSFVDKIKTIKEIIVKHKSANPGRRYYLCSYGDELYAIISGKSIRHAGNIAIAIMNKYEPIEFILTSYCSNKPIDYKFRGTRTRL